MCCGLPMPAVPSIALPALAFSQAMNSVSVVAGTEFLDTISGVPLAIQATGAKSASRSYGSL
jgi:hypothetical protein